MQRDVGQLRTHQSAWVPTEEKPERRLRGVHHDHGEGGTDPVQPADVPRDDLFELLQRLGFNLGDHVIHAVDDVRLPDFFEACPI